MNLNPLDRGSEAISPTAHYTGHIWVRNGLSHPELATTTGRALFEVTRPTMALLGLAVGTTLEQFLLERHRKIDERLARAIDDGLTQVLEVACGISGRGWRFKQRYGDRLTYVEADLRDMAARKRAALERMGSLGPRHRVMEVDALSDASLAAVVATLDPKEELAIITEGLLGYFEREQALGMWRRFAGTLSGFRAGLYLADMYVREDMSRVPIELARAVLGAFVRGRVHVHFEDDAEAARAARDAGFRDAVVHPTESLVRVLEANS